MEVNACGADARLGVGDAEEDNLVAALFEPERKGGHGIDVSCAWKAECSEPRHSCVPCSEFGPEVVTGEEMFRMLCV